LRCCLSYRDVAELLRAWGMMVTDELPHRSISVAPKVVRHLSAA
jgi:hypothetical protein